MKKTLKSLLGELSYRSGAYRRRFRDRAVIVTFHRVRDDVAENPISCSVDEFRSYCDFFARYFHVISLTELLDRLEHGQSLDRCLVITFDDGYSDNGRLAAPELARRNLPSCFFITTDFIGTEHQPWWDVEWNVRSEWMTWDEVRALRASGFEIGGHTRTHVDLGTVNPQLAETEIEGCRSRLELELGEPVRHFSYPFGGVAHVTESSRSLVRGAGFVSCLSAHGGTVRAGDDPFRLKRVAISPWFRSPGQFGHEIAFDRE